MTAPTPRPQQPLDTPDGFGADNRPASENSAKAWSAVELVIISAVVVIITALGLVAGC